MACIVCGGCDFFMDFSRGDTVCQSCGAVDPDLALRCETGAYRQIFDVNGGVLHNAPMAEPYVGGATCQTLDDAADEEVAKRGHSAPYSRLTYFNERIAQWRGLEPEIPYDDLQAIKSKYASMPVTQFTKDHLRVVLREIDKDRHTRKFVRKYLVSCSCSCSSTSAMQAGVCLHTCPYIWHKLRLKLVAVSSQHK